MHHMWKKIHVDIQTHGHTSVKTDIFLAYFTCNLSLLPIAYGLFHTPCFTAVRKFAALLGQGNATIQYFVVS